MRISQTSGEGYGRNPSPWPLITPHVPQAPPWPHWASSHLSPTSSLDSSCPLDFSVTWGDLRGAPLPPRQSSPLLAAAARASGVPVSLLTVHSISLTPSVRGANSGVSYSQLCSPPPAPPLIAPAVGAQVLCVNGSLARGSLEPLRRQTLQFKWQHPTPCCACKLGRHRDQAAGAPTGSCILM